MSMEGAAWSSLYRLSHSKDQKSFSRETVRRTFAFAAPYKGKITVFVLLSVVTAALAVATPVLAGAEQLARVACELLRLLDRVIQIDSGAEESEGPLLLGLFLYDLEIPAAGKVHYLRGEVF